MKSVDLNNILNCLKSTYLEKDTNSISEYTCLEEKTIYEYILGLQKENSCLKSNWINLKKWLLNDHFLYIPEVGANSPYNTVLRKMEELEKRKESIR